MNLLQLERNTSHDRGKSSDPIALAVCESEAFQLSSNLGVAAGYMHRSADICASSCNLVKPQQPAP